jgi:hypothetical protein
MQRVLGITGAAPIWKASMEAIFANPRIMSMLGESGQAPVDGFAQVPGISRVQICDLASLRAGGHCRPQFEWAAVETFRPDSEAVFGHFAIHGSGAERCGLPFGAGRTSPSSAMFRVERSPELASMIRTWAATNGIPVAPPPCLGH